jgi:hypothetical protein
VVCSEESLKGCSFSADGGEPTVTWMELGPVWPGKHALAQGHDALVQCFGRGGVAWTSRKDGIADDGLSAKAQAYAPRGVTRYVKNRRSFPADLDLHPIE